MTTDNFPAFSRAFRAHLSEMSQARLLVVRAERDEIWERYLAAFPVGTNPVFRKRTEHDCSCCRHFVRDLGGVVAFQNGALVTAWDLNGLPEPYQSVADALAAYVRTLPIADALYADHARHGLEKNSEWREGMTAVLTHHHLVAELPAALVVSNPAQVRGDVRTSQEMLHYALTNFSMGAVREVLELIEEKTLYRGEEHRRALEGFERLLMHAQNCSSEADLSHLAWQYCGHPQARFKNTVIGTLVADISEGTELEIAVKKFEAKVAPENYKRSKALITPRMIEDAVAKLEELGLSDAVRRRMARLEDVSVSDVLFVDNEVRGRMRGGLTDLLMSSSRVRPTQAGRGEATPIAIEDFMRLGAKSVQLVLENSHLGNFFTMTAPEHTDTGQLFRWKNDFAWAYDGEVADSMRQRVAAAGGRVDGPFRFTHSWNHEGRENQSLMDLHVLLPGTPHPTQKRQAAPGGRHQGRGLRIGWDARSDPASGGRQDVDHVEAAPTGFVPIENIAFPDVSRMREGVYHCYVHNWQLRGINRGGFKAELELNGEIHQYDYPAPLANYEWVHVAAVTLRDGRFEVEHKLKSSSEPQEKWGVRTLTPVRVDTILRSPNYWAGAGDVGNRHWFFVLDGCRNPNEVRGFFNEYLRPDLEKHRKVFEVLASRTRCPSVPDQLSGVGFTAARGDSVTAIADGRTYEVAF